jgi:hypothetical protein
MLTYDELNAIMATVETVNTWRPYGGLLATPIQHDEQQVYAHHHTGGVAISVFLRRGMWGNAWYLLLDPDNMPQSESDLRAYLDSHIFVEFDNPEKSIPPHTHNDFKYVDIRTAMQANWMSNAIEHLGLANR